MKIKKHREKGILFNRIIFIFTAVLFVGAVVLTVLVKDAAQRSRFAMNAVQCLIMLILMFLPMFVSSRFKFEIPKAMQIIYVAFCFCGIVLGEVYNFFDRFPNWDTILHTISGVLLASLGFIIINTVNRSAKVHVSLSPVFVCISVVLFAVALGAIWEIIEYLIDGIFGSNMQQFMETTLGTMVAESDIPLQGHAALRDTMKDLMLDLGGAVIIAIVGYFELKHGKKGIAKMGLDPTEDEKNEDEG